MTESPAQRFIIPIHSHGIVEFLDLLENQLSKRDIPASFIPQNEPIATTARRHFNQEDLQQGYLDHRPTTDFDALCEKYGINSPRALVFPQMVYDRAYDAPSYRPFWSSGSDSLPYSSYRDSLHRTLNYLDQLYENGDGGIPLQFQGGEVLRRALQCVADYHEFPSVRTSFSPVPGHVLFRSTEEMRLPALEAASYEEMTPDEREAAREFRESVIGDKQEVIGNISQTEPLTQNLRRKARRFREHRDDLVPVISDWVRRTIAKPALGAVTKRLYSSEAESRSFIKSNKYVFYPLQYFRESRVTMRAPAFYNQLWLIEYLSRSLPQDYELVVKDHPQQLGALPLSHVYKLRRYSTAIDPTISAREVISEADAVITLNNTVGFEALMFGKSVITLGDAFYNGAGYTRDADTLKQLPELLNSAVESDGPDDAAVLAFAHGILESSYEGIWGNTASNNVQNFVDSMLIFSHNIQSCNHE